MRSMFSGVQCFSMILMVIVSSAFSEKAGKFTWKGSLSGINTTTLKAPLKTVAMGEYIYVSKVLDQLTEKDPCSIMFIIDNSATNTGGSGTDHTAKRFAVVTDLVEMIYEKAPETKVGLIIFGSRMWMFNLDNPNLFTTFLLDGGDGAYIPPLDLKHIYTGKYRTRKPGLVGAGVQPSEQFDYTKSGKDLLKLYLETILYKFMSFEPADSRASRYQPVHAGGGGVGGTIGHGSEGTNITLAFEAAKHAHLNQEPPLQSKKNRHFNIFLSDGEATEGGDGYVQGKNVPTTFTVYYNPQSPNDLVKLQTMTGNIQKNGYSTSNPMSKIWNMTNWEDIKKALQQDVFNKILVNTTGTPVQISINSLTSTVWDSIGFLYKDIFPLQKGVTPFAINLKVHIKKDSLNDLGQIVSTIEMDSLFKFDINVTVGPDTTIPDSMTLKWWGRTLMWGNPGNVLTQVNSNINTIPFAFESYKIDTTFGYGVIPVEIRNSNNSDKESITLAKTGNIWAGTINRAIGNPVIGDGVLQHKEVDELIAVFRNPVLPIDTMEIRIPYTDAMIWSMGKSSFHDNNADGLIDSLHVAIRGERWEPNILAIADAIVLPVGRQLDKLNAKVDGKGIGFTLKQNSPFKNTAVNEPDSIRILNDVTLPNKSVMLKGAVLPEDFMAPVTLSALFADSVLTSAQDFLVVTYSEAVTVVQSENIHNFKTSSLNPFTVQLLKGIKNGNNVSYNVGTITGVATINDGDSLQINALTLPGLGDIPGNVQKNTKNVWAPITVDLIEDGIKIKRAAYFDKNADGYPDMIRLWMRGSGVEAHITDVSKNLTLPSLRYFTIVNTVCSANGIIDITVSSGSSASINTALLPNEAVSVKNTITFADSNFLLQATVPVEDSMAPVAVKAVCTDTMRHKIMGSITSDEVIKVQSLKVDFSENIGVVSESKPLSFLNNDIRDLDIKKISISNNTGVWNTINDVERIKPGDSVRINAKSSLSVQDPAGNIQKEPFNRKVPVEFVHIFDTLVISIPYMLEPKIIHYSVNKPLPKSVLDKIPGLNSTGSTQCSNGDYLSALIGLVPDEIKNVNKFDKFSATFTIVDPLGNLVAGPIQMVVKQGSNCPEGLFQLWNGLNRSGRTTGSGEYLVLFSVTVQKFHDLTESYYRKAFIAVMK